MLDLENLELAAYKGEPLPEGLSFLEEYYYIALRSLYSDYLNGRLSLQTAENEKRRLRADFLKSKELDDMRKNAYAEMAENIRQSDQIRIDALKGENLKDITAALAKYVSACTGDEPFYNSLAKKWGLE